MRHRGLVVHSKANNPESWPAFQRFALEIPGNDRIRAVSTPRTFPIHQRTKTERPKTTCSGVGKCRVYWIERRVAPGHHRLKGEGDEHLDSIVCNPVGRVDLWFHDVSRGRRADSPTACVRGDFLDCALRIGNANGVEVSHSTHTSRGLRWPRAQVRLRWPENPGTGHDPSSLLHLDCNEGEAAFARP